MKTIQTQIPATARVAQVCGSISSLWVKGIVDDADYNPQGYSHYDAAYLDRSDLEAVIMDIEHEFDHIAYAGGWIDAEGGYNYIGMNEEDGSPINTRVLPDDGSFAGIPMYRVEGGWVVR